VLFEHYERDRKGQTKHINETKALYARFHVLTAAIMKTRESLLGYSAVKSRSREMFRGATASIIRVMNDLPSFITPMMEAVRTSETLVYSNKTTWRYILEGKSARFTTSEEQKYRVKTQIMDY
jgi:hypothetical protein